jgi:caffeoyl-CoA O-methyltransferase
MEIVPEAFEAYVGEYSQSDDDLYARLTQATQTETSRSGMLSGQLVGNLLRILTQSLGAKRVLELGTFTGYSALKMAEGLSDDGRLVTCDVDREWTAIAERFWAESPHGHKIELRLGPALETIASLGGPFDLVFIDADKTQYGDYWNACMDKVRVGGLIVVDDVLWAGEILDPQDGSGRAIAAFNKMVKQDDRVAAIILTVGDGLTLARKK